MFDQVGLRGGKCSYLNLERVDLEPRPMPNRSQEQGAVSAPVNERDIECLKVWQEKVEFGAVCWLTSGLTPIDLGLGFPGGIVTVRSRERE